jgi:RNA polymerase sporulation-specific sigma factor
LYNDEEGGLSIQDVLYEEDVILERLALKEYIQRLRRLVGTLLDRREREIVSLRYGLGGRPALPQREVAARLGISRSYVSRLEKRALEKLRQGMETGCRD